MGFAKSYAEEAASRGYWSLDKTVCPTHIDDVLLRQLIAEYATETACSYCGNVNTDESPIAATFDDFMDRFMVGVHRRYGRANDEGVPFDEGDYVGTSTYDSGDVAQDILREAIDDYPDSAQDELVDDIVEAMLPDAWVRRNWQWLSKEQRLSYSWDEFKDLVKHKTRFLFIRWPKRRPSDPDDLSPLEFFNELVRLLYDLPEKIIDVHTPLYRGRMSLEEPDLNKFDADKLGPAPIDKAGANRMSPAGISMFYGATDIDTAVAEIGAHSSHSWAVVGEFKATEELRVVDLSNLPDLPSIFDTDEKAIERYDGIAFLHRFIKDLTLPIVLDGREHIDYVPTQVLTEYLRYSFPAPLHGLQFPSAQGSGHNVVLFFGPHNCAEAGDAGEHTALTLTTGSVTKYRVATVI